MDIIDTASTPHPFWQHLRQANRLASRHFSRAHRMGRRGYWNGAQWITLLIAFAGHCAYCGEVCDHPEPDHMAPLALGGDNRISNVVPSCPGCNRRKGGMHAESFVSRERMAWINRTHPYRNDRSGEHLCD